MKMEFAWHWGACGRCAEIGGEWEHEMGCDRNCGGAAGSPGLTRLLGTLLYSVKPSNPLVLGTVSLLRVCIGLLASCIPARRAAKVDPMVALRYE